MSIPSPYNQSRLTEASAWRSRREGKVSGEAEGRMELMICGTSLHKPSQVERTDDIVHDRDCGQHCHQPVRPTRDTESREQQQGQGEIERVARSKLNPARAHQE